MAISYNRNRGTLHLYGRTPVAVRMDLERSATASPQCDGEVAAHMKRVPQKQIAGIPVPGTLAIWAFRYESTVSYTTDKFAS